LLLLVLSLREGGLLKFSTFLFLSVGIEEFFPPAPILLTSENSFPVASVCVDDQLRIFVWISPPTLARMASIPLSDLLYWFSRLSFFMARLFPPFSGFTFHPPLKYF